MENKPRYIVIDHEGSCVFKTNEITSEIESEIKSGCYELIDLETMETINSNKEGLIRRPIHEI